MGAFLHVFFSIEIISSLLMRHSIEERRFGLHMGRLDLAWGV